MLNDELCKLRGHNSLFVNEPRSTRKSSSLFKGIGHFQTLRMTENILNAFIEFSYIYIEVPI